MTWKRFTRRDVCPVCNGERHDCRQNLETNLIHCRSLEANPLDYIYRGQDTWGFNLWAYKPDAEEWTDQRRQEWQLEQQRKRALKEQQEREQLKKLLPIKERDQVIRAILEQLTLSDAHRQRLKARGLTDLQIEFAGYRSVKQWQKLTTPVKNRLSGVNIRGDKLNNFTNGILIPIANEDGLYTALRVNNLEAATNGHGKYYWLSSAKRGIKVRLPNGELPITVYFPDKPSQTNQIGLCEGLEYKPLLAAKNLGIPVIGFPGSNFSISPKTLKALIKKIWTEWICTNSSTTSKGRSNSLNITNTEILSTATVSADGNPNIYSHSGKQKLDGTIQMVEPLKSLEDCGSSEKNYTEQCSIILIADAGVAVNPQISNSHISTMKMIDGWGYDIKLADWGQLNDKKNGLDIDEIDPTQTNINLIDIKEFGEIAEKEQYKIKTRLAWQESKRFTPTAIIEDDSQYLNLPTPKDNSMVFINAGLGTGKTTNLIKWLNGDWKDYGAISLGYRNTLLIQFCKKAGFTHIHEGDSHFYIKDSQGRVAACINSYFRFQPEDFEDKILILDEVVSIIKHLLFSNTISNRGEAITLFFEAIKKARVVVNMDGNLTDIYCDFLTKIDPSKAIQKIKKIDKNKKPELILLEGTIKNERIRKRDHSPWLYDLLNTLEMIACVASDSQILLESLDEIVQENNAKTLRVDSKTINQKEVKKFLENPIEWLKRNPIDYLFISPSCESGLDIPLTDYFTHFFGFFFGKLDPDSISQIIGRIRDAELTRYLWVAPFVKQDNPDSINSSLVESVKYHYNQRITRDIHGVLSGEVNSEAIISELLSIMKEAQNALETDISQKLQAANNYEKANLRDCTYWLLEQQGYDVSNRVAHDYNAALFDDTKNQVSSEKKEVKHQNCRDIINSSDKYIG
ncbi:MAG: plasmid replication protein, CyRepA1 family, partial [Crocosphaera sp.]